MLKDLFHSLSSRLLLLFIVSGAVLLLLIGIVVGKGYSTHLRSNVWPFMVHYVTLLERQLGTPPDVGRAHEITRGTPIAVHVYGPDQNWSTASRLPDRQSLVPAESASRTEFGKYQRYRLRSLDDALVLHTTHGKHDVFFQFNPPRSDTATNPYGRIIIWSIAGILFLIFFATRQLFRPIEEIQEGLSLIGSGHLDHRIIKRRDDELGDLADNVNAMADDIARMLEAKRQLLLGISHELRSPLTRSRVHLALMEDSDSRLELEQEIIAMEQMITELLESERLKARHVSLQREAVRLDTLIQDVVTREFSRRVQIMELAKEVADVDTARVKLLIRNLLQNAVKHSIDPLRKPTVASTVEPGYLAVYVTDSGGGIEAEQLPNLTEPFYRADPSRQRKTGGYGLGLYLCKVIMDAHEGKLEINSEIGVGTTIRCAFPLKS